MLVSAEAVASPFLTGRHGAEQLSELRLRIAQKVATALSRSFREKRFGSVLEEMIAAIGGEQSPQQVRPWGPELYSALSAVARPDRVGCSELLDLEIFFFRATSCDIDGSFRRSPNPGIGAVSGIPAWKLAGMHFERRDNRLVLHASRLAASLPGEFIVPSAFEGSSQELTDLVVHGNGSHRREGAAADDCHAVVSEAGRILSKAGAAPAWVESAITTLYVTSNEISTSRSGSWERYPGLCFFSELEDPYQVADVLLHEACHQNFYLANINGDLLEDDGSQRYSFAADQARPLWAILMAYHAFANVAALFSRLPDLTLGRKHRYTARSVQCLGALDKTLSVVKFSKPSARNLYEHLHALARDAMARL